MHHKNYQQLIFNFSVALQMILPPSVLSHLACNLFHPFTNGDIIILLLSSFSVVPISYLIQGFSNFRTIEDYSIQNGSDYLIRLSGGDINTYSQTFSIINLNYQSPDGSSNNKGGSTGSTSTGTPSTGTSGSSILDNAAMKTHAPSVSILFITLLFAALIIL